MVNFTAALGLVEENMLKNVLYIHGFNSSPLSLKAVQVKAFFAKNYSEINFHCPQLANSPQAAITQLAAIISQGDSDSWALFGSSLGGFFASYLADKYHCPAILINPAIKPYDSLANYLGEQKNPYTGITYQVTPHYMSQLIAIDTQAPTAQCKQKNNYLVMVQTGDEVLDYQQAVEKFQHCRLLVEEGGDHSFVGFDKKLLDIAGFLQLKPTLTP